MPFAPVGPRPVLVCLPQAGAGCGVFRSWQGILGDEVAVVGVQLPARESRFTEPPVGSVAEAVAHIVAALVETVPAGRPLVLFGHSLGGLLGYEVARALPPSHRPAALVVAASRPPHLSGRAAGSIRDDAAEFAERLADKELDEDLRELAMDVLRQDAVLSATYEDPGGAPVPCDLHAWGGDADAMVTAAQLAEWRGYAGAAFHTRRFPGGHDFCVASAEVPFAARALFAAARQEV
jgi:surfactin synthase thioesterase subunit